MTFNPYKVAAGIASGSNVKVSVPLAVAAWSSVRDVSDSYFGEIANGVTNRASELGYLSFVCNTGRNPEDELRYHEHLWQHRVKGIILAGGGLDQVDYKKKLKNLQIFPQFKK